jgi:hypothetical protein
MRDAFLEDINPPAIVRPAADLAALATQINEQHRLCDNSSKQGLSMPAMRENGAVK